MALLAAFSGQARGAALDKSFGTQGRTGARFAYTGTQPEYDSIGSWENAALTVVAGPDGSTVVAGKHQIARFLPNGHLDTGFGAGGRLTPATLEGLAFEIADVAFDHQGRLLVFGTGEDLSVEKHLDFYFSGAYVHPSYAVVARYTANGSLDPTFGGGDGAAHSDFGVRVSATVDDGGPAPPMVGAIGGAVDGQGRPVVLAKTLELQARVHGSSLVDSAAFVARFSPAGDWEGGFGGGDGIVQPGGRRATGSLVPLKSGALMLAGTSEFFEAGKGTRSFTQITKLSPEGSIVGAYGADGTQIVAGSLDAVRDSKGRLVLLLGERPHQRLLRLLANGRVDKRFGHGGRVGLKLSPDAAASSLAIDGRGRMLVAGVSGLVQESDGNVLRSYGLRLLALRLRADGSLDRGFGPGGRLRTRFGRTRLATAPAAAVDSRGRLVVADPGQSPNLPEGGVFLAAYGSGGLDLARPGLKR